ncbi:MAG TPA: NAD(P)H-dependent oxidoreductase subunit E [candidate division Zixibacteria bacterium]|nr:NAD(P)H-dependent oxidoreductase subunit E [candidate division Zixibacteria bacterium]MDD4917056.1 NAD(P)H-dependent oxidoreductase subunit E [candidate division Zixibacteria bacterium]MDM7972962.1 NAD(P)H-dependent oxidoreductase subunit E [candidate division Zixibacteria bacterium]HOD65282.1 NAD(P)H-dependent oxidoreductase subunit E [candidate division Zixibacteria bacterium]HOZ07110.1 NAD(P)H-dependent oxidoreductase subunit E [candidate division Zixibacteria bacterium]
MKHDFSRLPDIIGRYPAEPGSLIAVLQDIQKEYNFLPCEALTAAAQALHVPLSKVFSVSTFYNAFCLTPRGDKIIRVCMGTTCHIRGAKQLLEQLETRLGIKAGQTTRDMKFTIEVVNCVGACAMAPVVIINDEYHGDCKVSDARRFTIGAKKDRKEAAE